MKKISKYWEYLSEKSNELVDLYGIDHIRESVSRIYNDDNGIEMLLDETKKLWEILYKIMPQDYLASLSEPMVGTPRYVLCDNRPVTIDLGISFFDYWIMKQSIDFTRIESILEIGGGYGRLPFVIKSKHKYVKYTMCDIQPALNIAKWYLGEVFPKNDIRFVEPDELDGKFDLVIACNCLHEMVPEQVEHYFDYVDKNAKYFFYTCWKDTKMPKDNIRWTENDYPVRNTWRLLSSGQYIKQDYFMRLYKI